MRRLLLVLAVLGLLLVVYTGLLLGGRLGRHRGPGEPTAATLSPELVAGRSRERRLAGARPGIREPKQVLFGDLHVHTTFSTDAFLGSLPMTQGEGAHPPADACDFARFCAALDFWSINDHAEGLTPQRWAETQQAIRSCNAVAGDSRDPDVVAFLGWEWTQVGATPDEHYGHKNVILRDTEAGKVPPRPIASAGLARDALRNVPRRARLLPALIDFGSRQEYYDFDRFLSELEEVPDCAVGVDSRKLPSDCLEAAATPRELFEKLAQWGGEALVIPHGTAWGLYTPPGSTWRKQLQPGVHDPSRQTLIEVFSGHGNSEEYRDWRGLRLDAKGRPSCPEPGAGYEPSCWRAGEIIRERCASEGLAAETCEERAARARQHHVEAGVAGWHTVPGARVPDWLDAGQCRDCFLPAFNYRPGGSAQYTLGISRFGHATGPRRFRFGFIASSDNHSARPGTGYKEVARGSMSDRRGPRDEAWYRRLTPEPQAARAESVAFDRDSSPLPGFQLLEFERQASFFLTGGLVATHAKGRDRAAIWESLERREVYGTSGERILLWFDIQNPRQPDRLLPMGSEVATSRLPRFRVKAVGAFRQKPGCPDASVAALGPERLEQLCRGECYHPSDERKRITRIEIVRIRPQLYPEEPLAELIEDPWRSFACPPDPAGCSVDFEDPEFPAQARDTVYYARAVQEPSPAINAASLRCRGDETGPCVEVDPCYGDYRTAYDDDCLAEHEPRAWSSPIFVDYDPR